MKYTLYEIVISIAKYKNTTLHDIADKLEMSELQLARDLNKNKKIDKELLLNIFDLLEVSLIDNKTNEKIKIHNIDELLSDAINNL